MFVMRSFCVFVFILALAVSVFANPEQQPPKWPDTYIASATLNIPYAEIQEPIFAWYDNKTKRSRIDYYGGMVKTYQLPNKTKYGTSLKIAPVTTKLEINTESCFQKHGTTKQKIDIQSILPETKSFIFIGNETLRGVMCDKFRLEEVVGLKKNIYTLWVGYKKLLNPPSTRQVFPVRYEMKGYNTLLSSHYDHYYLDYDRYSIDNITDEVFEISSDIKCKSLFDNEAGHYATFNPMEEFVHPTKSDRLDLEFRIFKDKHGVQYMNETEHEFRKNVFSQNLRFIHSKNRAKLSYSLAVNHLADKTEGELKARSGFRSSGAYNTGKPFPSRSQKLKDNLPEQFDWRLLGAVTPVKDQSVCGSCWAFGTVGVIEGAFFLKNGGNLVRFSQQALIDCSWGYDNYGCDGGSYSSAFKWIQDNGGIPTEDDYGNYLGQDGYCNVNNVTKVANISKVFIVKCNDPKAFKTALVENGPLSVAIDASHRSFWFYSHGIYYEPQCKNRRNELNHALLAVGYGQFNGKHYWLLKNSWSTHWGNDGYILMSVENNNCGVMRIPFFVKM